MIIGPKRNKWFSTDSPNVPTSGRYGDVRAFERKANKVGLHVAWSAHLELFVIYTERGYGNYVMQAVCGDQGSYEPTPLTSKYLSFLLILWNKFAQRGKYTLTAILEQRKRDEASRLRNEQLTAMALIRNEALQAYRLEMGIKTPMIMSVGRQVRVGK